jgi:hypothetical protein
MSKGSTFFVARTGTSGNFAPPDENAAALYKNGVPFGNVTGTLCFINGAASDPHDAPLVLLPGLTYEALAGDKPEIFAAMFLRAILTGPTVYPATISGKSTGPDAWNYAGCLEEQGWLPRNGQTAVYKGSIPVEDVGDIREVINAVYRSSKALCPYYSGEPMIKALIEKNVPHLYEELFGLSQEELLQLGRAVVALNNKVDIRNLCSTGSEVNYFPRFVLPEVHQPFDVKTFSSFLTNALEYSKASRGSDEGNVIFQCGLGDGGYGTKVLTEPEVTSLVTEINSLTPEELSQKIRNFLGFPDAKEAIDVAPFLKTAESFSYEIVVGREDTLCIAGPKIMSQKRGTEYAGFAVSSDRFEFPVSEREKIAALVEPLIQYAVTLGYKGTFGIDLFAYENNCGQRCFGVSEINARPNATTFLLAKLVQYGSIAAALQEGKLSIRTDEHLYCGRKVSSSTDFYMRCRELGIPIATPNSPDGVLLLCPVYTGEVDPKRGTHLSVAYLSQEKNSFEHVQRYREKVIEAFQVNKNSLGKISEEVDRRFAA